MKDNPRKTAHLRKMGFFHAFLSVFMMVMLACDFDIPEKFEMPTWYLDLKIPLVQAKYQMTDVSDDSTIFLTDDSLGFKIIQEGTMEATPLPDLPAIPDGDESLIDEAISSGEIEGISIDMDLPSITISQRIDVVAYDQVIYPDTTDYYIDTTVTLIDTTVFPPEPYDTTISIKVADFTPFSFPTDTIMTMEKEYYNSLIVAVFDSVMGILSAALDTTINLGLSSIPLPDEPPIIASIDTLIIATHETNSIYQTLFKNNGIPTALENVYSYMITGNSYPLNDTLANHNQMLTISNGQTYADTTNLSGFGLTSFLNMATSMSLAAATEDYVTIPPGSLYVDFSITFQMDGIDSIDVTTNEYSLSDGIEMPDMSIPEMDMSESGISRMELYRALLKDEGSFGTENFLNITELASTFPFDMNFLMNFQNFSPYAGGDSVKIDTILNNSLDEINRTFNMRGYDLQSPGYPDSAMGSFDLALDIAIPMQKATIPLDGSPLGEFTMKMALDRISFQELEANLYMEMPTDSTEQEFPAGFTGAIPTEAVIEIIFKNQIRLPIEMILDFKGYNSLGEMTYMPVLVDTIGIPLTDESTDTSMTIIGLSKLGTTITIYESLNDSLPSYQKITAPCDTCASIIDLLASNPVQMIITPEVKVDGRGEIEPGKAIAGSFRVTIPFVLQLEPMAFVGGVATEIEEFDHETRYKIRNSLIQTDLVSTITNAMPFGAEVSVLMSNDTLFPVDTNRAQLDMYRDSLAAKGVLNPNDSLYILRNCTALSPDSGRIYIFNVMTDYKECLDGLPYIVKFDGSGTDTVISYVDTLFKFIMPDPKQYYGQNDTSGYPEGMVAVPGTGVYASTIDTSQIFLLTDYGSHYTMPRFYLPGTDSMGVFISVEDYLEISSFITFRLSSSGAFAPAENELVITSPNGGETLYNDSSYEIQWQSYGEGTETINLFYSTTGDTGTYKQGNCTENENWTELVSGVANTGSYTWDLSSMGITDSLRLKIMTTNEKSCDINGHYVTIDSSRTNRMNNRKRQISLRNR